MAWLAGHYRVETFWSSGATAAVDQIVLLTVALWSVAVRDQILGPMTPLSWHRWLLLPLSDSSDALNVRQDWWLSEGSEMRELIKQLEKGRVCIEESRGDDFIHPCSAAPAGLVFSCPGSSHLHHSRLLIRQLSWSASLHFVRLRVFG